MIERTLGPLLGLMLVFIAASTFAVDPPATRSTEAPDLQAWWADLQKAEPEASRALLNFSDHPAESVAFFRKQLRPLKLDADELNLLLGALGSDKESQWKPACEQLEYLDPRLAMDLDSLMKSVTEYPARSRLVAILCDYPPEVYKGKKIELRPSGKPPDIYYNFFDGRSSWWAEAKIERLGKGLGENNKKKWQRAIRAIVLLKHIGTPEALAIIQDLSTGHPDALPTKVAKEALATK